jgi:DNA-binding beta-propeller fold protein YncE
LAPLCCLLAVLAAGLGIRPAKAQLQSGEQQIVMPGSPFPVKTTPNGRWALVSVSRSVTLGAVVGSNGIVVLERTAGTYRYVSFVPLQDPPSGLALTRDGSLPATLRTFCVGVFPREWALSPDGRKLFLTEFGSSVLDIFDADTLRRQTADGRNGEDAGGAGQ